MTMLGWESLAADLPSRWNRRPISGSIGIRFYDLDGDGTIEYLVTPQEYAGHPARAELAHEHEPIPEAVHKTSGAHARD